MLKSRLVDTFWLCLRSMLMTTREFSIRFRRRIFPRVDGARNWAVLRPPFWHSLT